ncbi:hypothetical protein chiPu_0020325, partial [Chiloscyllium punctatum]|nr:hypothetical protein [Chiloscyllium punctatum]
MYGAGEEADGAGEEADGPGEEAGGPGEEAGGPGEEAGGPGEDRPVEEADGPGEGADGPGDEAQNLEEGPDDSRVEADETKDTDDGAMWEAAGGLWVDVLGKARDTADGDTADGDTADGDTADGDTADGDTADRLCQCERLANEPGVGENEAGGHEGDGNKGDEPREDGEEVDGNEGDEPQEDGEEVDGNERDEPGGDGEEVGGNERDEPGGDGEEVGGNEGDEPGGDGEEVGGNEGDEPGGDGEEVGGNEGDEPGGDGEEVFGNEPREDGGEVDECVGTLLTGTSKLLNYEGEKNMTTLSPNTQSWDVKEELGQNEEPVELSRSSITAEQGETSERDNQLGISPENTVEKVSLTNSNCVLGFAVESGYRRLLKQDSEASEGIDGMLPLYFERADLGRGSELVDKVGADKPVTTDWNNTRSRARSLSVKVPDTVLEETGIPLQKAGRAAGEDCNLGDVSVNRRLFTAKHRCYTFYPRSFSVEAKDLPISIYRQTERLFDNKMETMEDNLSLLSVVPPSGSLLKPNPLPTSAASSPSSVVDIPPPFELASITKKPITKSSPSLLLENESPDKYLKQNAKKKSSFKRFLPIKFRKKVENKIAVEVNVCKPQSDTVRVLDFDRRSLGNSPQIKTRSGKIRVWDSSSTFLINKDGKRKGTPKPFSRSVTRVESFEDRSRLSYSSLPLTKPRSISFPNADTSDYENIPAVSSDYENVQIPSRRNGRSGTFTEFFDNPSRAFSSASENDGYVDMSSFTPFESRKNMDQELE